MYFLFFLIDDAEGDLTPPLVCNYLQLVYVSQFKKTLLVAHLFDQVYSCDYNTASETDLQNTQRMLLINSLPQSRVQ